MTAVHGDRASQGGGPLATRLDDLVRGLLHEAKLLTELRAILIRQREAVAADDGVGLEAVVQDIGRALVTLGEARRRRITLLGTLSDADPPSLDEVAAHLAPADRPHFQAAREHLRTVAQGTGRDLAINQAVLRRVIESGERFLQQLFGGPAGEDEGAVLVNRRA